MRLEDFDFRIWDSHKGEFISTILSGVNCNNCACSVGIFWEGWDLSWNPDDDDQTEYREIELYTGFRDKDGDKIYEGDILSNDNEAATYEIKRYKNGRMVAVNTSNRNVLEIEELLKNEPTTEIVGNIHGIED